MRRPLLTAAALAAVLIQPLSASGAPVQLAQVEVVESSPVIRAIGQQRGTSASDSENPDSGDAAAINVQSELYYRLQVLEQEVQALRGLVEEQSNELRQLKQQRLDDYVDLDRRLSELSEQVGSGQAGSAGNGSSGSRQTTGGNGADQGGEFASYSAAVDLATGQQEFDRAVVALQQHLEDYPDGRYAANAHYWLGQIHLVQGDMEKARQAFTAVVDEYPNHNKAPEARYKLGQVYFRLDDKEKAKSLLEEVANGDSDSAALARNFLDQNYP